MGFGKAKIKTYKAKLQSKYENGATGRPWRRAWRNEQGAEGSGKGLALNRDRLVLMRSNPNLEGRNLPPHSLTREGDCLFCEVEITTVTSLLRNDIRPAAGPVKAVAN